MGGDSTFIFGEADSERGAVHFLGLQRKTNEREESERTDEDVLLVQEKDEVNVGEPRTVTNGIEEL